MPRKAFAIAALALGILGAVSVLSAYKFGIARAKVFADAHFESRSTAIMSQARQRDWPVVVLGDSLTELAMIDTLCGKPVLNAGISGARVARMAEFGEELLGEIEPELVIVALGTNDAWAHDPTDPARFEADYRKLVDEARASGASVVALTVPPVSAPDFGDAAVFDPNHLDARNRTIGSLGVPVVDIAAALSDEQGLLSRAYTDDGVHPNSAGYDRWIDRLSQACDDQGPLLAAKGR